MLIRKNICICIGIGIRIRIRIYASTHLLFFVSSDGSAFDQLIRPVEKRRLRSDLPCRSSTINGRICMGKKKRRLKPAQKVSYFAILIINLLKLSRIPYACLKVVCDVPSRAFKWTN